MKTSQIKIRPFVPYLKDETKEGREPYAILKYGNVEIELDYTVMCHIKLDIKSDAWAKTVAITNAAFEEILKEMRLKMDGILPNTHRDGNHPILKSIANNPLHPINKEHIML